MKIFDRVFEKTKIPYGEKPHHVRITLKKIMMHLLASHVFIEISKFGGKLTKMVVTLFSVYACWTIKVPLEEFSKRKFSTKKSEKYSTKN